MKPDLNMVARQEQGLVMTQALKQALHILTLPTLELTVLIQEEIEKNPLLELNASSNLEKSEFFEQFIPSRPSLFEHLMLQAREVFREQKELIIACEILGNLDDRGFFTMPIKELALSCQCPLEKTTYILEKIQTFDPPGIAAKDTQESFLLQLKALSKEKTQAYEIISTSYEDLLHGRLKNLERKFSLGNFKLLEIIQKDISTLHLNPGAAFDKTPISILKPDLILEEKLEIEEKTLPIIRFNPSYDSLLKDQNITKEEKQLLRGYIASGKWLLRALSRRKSILKELGDFLLSVQGDYLKGETSILEPLTITQAANALGLNESTVARAVQNKSISCPRGVIPLRQLFTSKLTLASGKVISNDTAKNLLLQLIKQEDKMRPLSDEELSNQMRESGIDIARRTISKYRKELKILSSLRRKKVND